MKGRDKNYKRTTNLNSYNRHYQIIGSDQTENKYSNKTKTPINTSNIWDTFQIKLELILENYIQSWRFSNKIYILITKEGIIINYYSLNSHK